MQMPPDNPEGDRQLQSSARLLHEDVGFATNRIAAFQYIAVGVFLFLAVGFWILQIRDHEANSEAAAANSIKTVPMLAPRGKILDRDGRVIVDNHDSYQLRLTQENLKLEHLPQIAEA